MVAELVSFYFLLFFLYIIVLILFFIFVWLHYNVIHIRDFNMGLFVNQHATVICRSMIMLHIGTVFGLLQVISINF